MPGAGDPVFLDAEAEAEIRQRVARLEAATGAEAVAAVVARSDSYPEIPWKAFALGTSLAAGAAFAAALLAPQWAGVAAVMETAVTMLVVGAAAALPTVWCPPLARLFLPRARRQAEALQTAQAMFLESELQRTRGRDAVLLLVCLFEREVVVLPDHGLQGRLGQDALDAVAGAVVARLAAGRLKEGLLDGLARLEDALLASGLRAGAGEAGEIPDAVIQQQGSS